MTLTARTAIADGIRRPRRAAYSRGEGGGPRGVKYGGDGGGPATVTEFPTVHGRQLPRNDETMSQKAARDDDDLQPEYDFSAGVRGKHFEAYRKGTNVIFLDPDVAAVFKDSAAVNTALRLLLTLAREQVPDE
jgi:hypothetical protein